MSKGEIESFLENFEFYGLKLTPPIWQKIFIIYSILIILEFAMVLFLLKLFVLKIPQDISQTRKILIGTIIDAGIFLILITLIMRIGLMETFSFTPYIIAVFPYLCLSVLTKRWSGYELNRGRLIASSLEYILLVVLYHINILLIIGAVNFSWTSPHY